MPRFALFLPLFALMSGCDGSEKTESTPALEATSSAVAQAPSPAPKPSPTQTPPDFDGERALAEISALTEFGNRYYGAPKRDEAIAILKSRLAELSDLVLEQPFKRTESVSGIEYDLVNLVGRVRPKLSRRVILGTHFDTRLWAEKDPDEKLRDKPIPGANDGTSGVALLFELLRAIKSYPSLEAIGIDVVLFDAEEFGRPSNGEYSQGAEVFALSLPGLYADAPAEAAIIIDMLADADLKIKRELSSERKAKALNDLIWRHGKARDANVFVDTTFGPIIDDHAPLQKAGISTVLLLDLDYPPWHTHADTVDKCSAKSLELVGSVLIDVLIEIAEKGAP